MDLVNTSIARKQDGDGDGDGDSSDKKAPEEDRAVIVEKINKAYLESSYAKDALNFTVPPEEHGSTLFEQVDKNIYITPWYNQFRVVFIRSFLHKFREPVALMTQVFSAVMTPIIFGSVYWQINESQQAALDRLSAISLMFLMAAFFAFDVSMI